MKHNWSRIVTYIVIVAAVYFIVSPLTIFLHTAEESSDKMPTMRLRSSTFEHNGVIPKEFTCDGKRIHPPLTIVDPPVKAKSFAIVVDDPDAPGGTFTHWLMWNIDAQIRDVKPGSPPHLAQQGTTSAGREGYIPPCPSSGEHRYFFTLYALDTTLGIDGKATKADLEKAMKGHVISQDLFIGTYSR